MLNQIEKAVETAPALQGLGTQASATLHQAVMSGGPAARRTADVLHGTWLGHPLHPALTDVTMGAWTLGAAFDAVGALSDDPFARRVGDRLAVVGTASALPTALAGLADYSTVPTEAARPATLHGLLNVAGLGLYLLSLRERGRGRHRRGLVFSGMGMAVATASAWIGGHLVYRDRVGVDHAERTPGPESWTPVTQLADLPDGATRCVEVEGKRVLVHREGDRVSAIGAVCGHAGGPLEDGTFERHHVQCPWHDSVFDLRDGSVVHGPATHAQPRYETRVEGDRVEVRRPEGAP